VTRGRALAATIALGLGMPALGGCGGEETERTGGGAGGSSPVGGSSGDGGATAEGGSAGAAGGASAAGGPSGLQEACDGAQGMRIPSGPCFKGCSYNGALEPLYDANGDCSRLGYKCGTLEYCIPNIRCSTHEACQAQGGPGWSCITTVGPFVGQCLLACTSDGDCPASGRPSPYLCKPVESVGVCRY
jgi:hypothetical protein